MIRRQPARDPRTGLTPAEERRVAVELAGLREQLRERREMLEALVRLRAFMDKRASK